MRRIKRIPKLPLPAHPDQVIREYYRNLRKYADAYVLIMNEKLEHILPALREVAKYERPALLRKDSIRMDTNIEDRIKALFSSVETELERTYPAEILAQWARSMIGHTNRHAKKNTSKFAERIGLDVAAILHDKQLAPFFTNVVDEQVGLIRSISKGRLASFKNGLVYAITNDMPQDQLRKLIQGHFRVSKNKAKLLAVDQVGKLNGDLNEYRQRQLGITRYKWRGSKDTRERHDHNLLNDTIQYWSKPPITNRKTGARNHPGKDIRCRCRAEAVVEDILD